MKNPKSEARNPKQHEFTKSKCSKQNILNIEFIGGPLC